MGEKQEYMDWTFFWDTTKRRRIFPERIQSQENTRIKSSDESLPLGERAFCHLRRVVQMPQEPSTVEKWKRKAEAKEIQYQEVLEEKMALQKAIQVLEHQLLRQESRINQVIQDWRDNDDHWRRVYGQVVDSNN